MPQATILLPTILAVVLVATGCRPESTQSEPVPPDAADTAASESLPRPVAEREVLSLSSRDVFCLDQLGAYMTDQPPPGPERYQEANRVQLLVLAESALEEALLERETSALIEALPPGAVDELYARVPPLARRREELARIDSEPSDSWSCLTSEYVDRFVARRAALDSWTASRSEPMTIERLWERYQREATEFVVELAIVPNIASPAAIDAFVTDAPEAIERAFLERPWLQQQAPRARARIVRLSVPETASAQEEEAARQRLADARAAVEGEGFATIAGRVSDSESAVDGGDIGWIVRAQYPELYDTPTGELSPIFRDRYGLYFGEIVAREEGRARELDERLQRELAGELLRREGPQPQSMQDATRLLERVAAGEDPEAAAGELQIQWLETPPFRAAGTDVVPHVGQAPELVDAIVSQLLEPGDMLEEPVHVRAGIVVARLISRTPPNRLDFERERDRFARRMQDLDQRDAWEHFVEGYADAHPSQVRIEDLRAELIDLAQAASSPSE